MRICVNNWSNRRKINSIFILASIVFGVSFGLINYINDDVALYYRIGNSIRDFWAYSVEIYDSWSSRIFINLVWFIVLKSGVRGFALYMAVSMFLLLRGLYELMDTDGTATDVVFVIMVSMLFPFSSLTTAGWIATSTSYFGPQAAGVWALVPLKKTLCGEKISNSSFGLYILAMLYSANAEQMNVALVFCYTVAIVVLAVKKRFDWRLMVLYLIAIGSMVSMLKCPGNYRRSDMELVDHFPTYKTMDLIDKMDMGLSTTLHWLIVGGNILFLVICSLLVFEIFQQYTNKIYRIIALFPVVLCLALGPMASIVSVVFPQFSMLTQNVDMLGSFTIASSGEGIGMLQFFIFLCMCLALIVCMLLLNNSVTGLIVDLTVILAGVGSRLMMAFSPSIYASGERTFTTLAVFFMIFCVMNFGKNKTKFKISVPKFISALSIIILMSYINLLSIIVS